MRTTELVVGAVFALGVGVIGGLLIAGLIDPVDAWLQERRLDWRVRRIAGRRGLDAAYELLVEEEAQFIAEARAVLDEVEAVLDELDEPWDSSTWLEDAPREGGDR